MIFFLFEFFKIGLFTYGGGLAMIPLLQGISAQNAWLTSKQFADLIAISQSTPGPIAINMATYIGYRQFDVTGALLASVVLVLPGFGLAIGLSKVLAKYRKHPYVIAGFVGLKAAVIGLIGTAIIQVAKVSLYEEEAHSLFKFWEGLDMRAVVVLILAYLLISTTQKHPLRYIAVFGFASIFIW